MNESKVYDVPEVLAALEAAVAEKGEDYVYVNEKGQCAPRASVCYYVHYRDTGNATPGCIVGNVYHRLSGEFVPTHVEESTVLDEWFEGRFTGEAQNVLKYAQAAQDAGDSWGEALRGARPRVGI